MRRAPWSIALIAILAGLAGCAPTLEFRAEVECTAGQKRVMAQNNGSEICLSSDKILDDANVVAVSRIENGRVPHSLRVTFDEAGQKQFFTFTNSHIGKKLAILVDGKIISDPFIAEPIPGGAAELIVTPESEASLLKRFPVKATKP